MALRKKDTIAKSLHKLLKWIKDLNPWIHTKQQMVLDTYPELKDQWLVLLTEQFNKEISCQTFKRHREVLRS